MSLSVSLLSLWQEARTRFSNQLKQLEETDLQKTLPNSPNSIGFLIRHIGDVEMLLGELGIHVVAKTVIDQHDTGAWTNLSELKAYVSESFDHLKSILEHQKDADWETVIETKEFGTKTKAEALGRIISHTAYHAGQMGLILKYGANLPAKAGS